MESQSTRELVHLERLDGFTTCQKLKLKSSENYRIQDGISEYDMSRYETSYLIN